MITPLKSKYLSLLIIVVLLLFLFRGIFETYAFTDGYDLLWSGSRNKDFINLFLQQGRGFSGWISTLFYPNMEHVKDLSEIRMLNLACLFISCILIHGMLKRNNISAFNALAIVIVFICSPFSSIAVHWEASSSAIWGTPLALLSGDLVLAAYLNKEVITKKRFNLMIYAGIALALLSLFTYQPGYTIFIFPAFLHFINGQKRDVIKRFLLLHVFIYGIYFLLFKFQLNHLHITPDTRSGIVISPVKPFIFLKGVLGRSLYHNAIFASIGIQIIVMLVTTALIGYFVYTKTKGESKKNAWNFVGMLFVFYTLGYFPNLISADNFVAYRTMGTVILITSFLLIIAIATLPLKLKYSSLIISVLLIASIGLAFYNNKVISNIQSKEYAVVKNVIAEKLKQAYPKKVMVIMPEEDFLAEQQLVPNVVTDEFGKLSNTVYWVPKPFVQQIIYDITNNKSLAQGTEITYYKRFELPADSIVQQNDWVLDIEKIYLLGKP